MTKSDSIVLAHILQNQTASDCAISMSTGMSLRTVQRSLSRLRKSGLIQTKTTKVALAGWYNKREIDINECGIHKSKERGQGCPS